VATTSGWFVVNVRDAAWVTSDTLADASPEAYAPIGRWRPGRPASCDGLPWELR
jgi:hypothetical protein